MAAPPYRWIDPMVTVKFPYWQPRPFHSPCHAYWFSLTLSLSHYGRVLPVGDCSKGIRVNARWVITFGGQAPLFLKAHLPSLRTSLAGGALRKTDVWLTHWVYGWGEGCKVVVRSLFCLIRKTFSYVFFCCIQHVEYSYSHNIWTICENLSYCQIWYILQMPFMFFWVQYLDMHCTISYRFVTVSYLVYVIFAAL